MKKVWLVVGSLVAVSVLVWDLANLPLGRDWHYFFYEVGRNYITGDTHLYDQGGLGVHNPPWVLLLLVPFCLLPETTGLLAFRAVGLVVFCWCATSLGSYRGSRLLLVAPILASLAVWDTMVSGNVDFVALLGLVLMWNGLRRDNPYLFGLGLTTAFIKPQLAIFPTLALIPQVGIWSWRMRAKILTIPLVAVGISFVLAGIDWPLRFLLSIRERSQDLMEVSVTLYRALELVARWAGWPLWLPAFITVAIAVVALRICWQTKDLRRRLALGIAFGPVVIPYMWSGSLSLSAVGAWPSLLESRRYAVAAIIYAGQYLLVLRGFFGWESVWVLNVFSLGLLFSLLSLKGLPEAERT